MIKGYLEVSPVEEKGILIGYSLAASLMHEDPQTLEGGLLAWEKKWTHGVIEKKKKRNF